MESVYDEVRPDAQSLKPAELKEFSSDLELVLYNANLGITAVEKHAPQLKLITKGYDWAGPKLRLYLKALVETTTEVERARLPVSGARELTAEVFADRDLLMANLTLWGKVGIVPTAEVERIYAGKGPFDAARDVLDIAELSQRVPEAKRRLMLGEASLDAMVDRANRLLAKLRPAGARERSNDALTEALEAQSRVWTLVLTKHEELWADGARIFKKDVDAHVPPLLSRSNKRSPDPVTEPEPAPGPS